MHAIALSLLLSFQSVAAVQAADAVAPTQDREVVMYVTKSCGYCVRARQYFTERGIRWKEIDIESSKDAAAQFAALGGIGTPLIFIGKKRIVGFNQAQIDSAL